MSHYLTHNSFYYLRTNSNTEVCTEKIGLLAGYTLLFFYFLGRLKLFKLGNDLVMN